MNHLTRFILSILEKNISLPHERETYTYGISQFLYTMLNTFLLISWGFILGFVFEACIAIVVFYSNQSYGGGFHAQTRLSCFCTMFIGLTGFIILHAIVLPKEIVTTLFFFSIFLLWKYPLILHQNKAYLAKRNDRLVMKSRFLTFLQIILFSLSQLLGYEAFSYSFSLALSFCAISRVVAVRKREK